MRRYTLFFIVCLFWASAASAQTIRFNPDASTQLLGTSFSIDIVGQNFPETGQGGLDVFFDPTVLRADGVDFINTDIDFEQGVVDNIDNVTGKIDSILVASLLAPHPSGDFTIATVLFTVIGLGASPLNLAPSTLTFPWQTPTGTDINPTLTDGSVTVIPLPAAAWLLLSGLAVLGTLGKRKWCG